MKKILSVLLALCIAVGALPTTVFAADPPPNTSESEPVLLGTEAEYASTLATMYDQYGLRKVSVGFNSNSGTLNKKVGLVNKYGNFVAQPIYDEIRLHTRGEGRGDIAVTVQQLNFIGGYTQAVRDGKMGLLNYRGEEVVPCKYDFVQLPSEGVCAVFVEKSKDVYYLGYWNIEQNREIVAPNKYVTTYKNHAIGYGEAPWTFEKKPTGDYYMVHDFIGGHGLVFNEVTKTQTAMGTVVDKNGTEILKQSYPVYTYKMTNGFDDYPQKGPYLAFVEVKDVSDYRFTKLNNEWGPKKDQPLTEKSTYVTGLAGKGKTLIPASYTTGVRAMPGEREFYLSAATFRIIWEKGLVLTMKDTRPGYLYGGSYGVIDVNGKVVVPFTDLPGELAYYEDGNVFASTAGFMYSTTGKKLIPHKQFDMNVMKNGYAVGRTLGEYSNEKGSYHRTVRVVRADGAELNVSKVLGLDPYHRTVGFSDMSSTDMIWIKNNSGKWGLIDFSGKIIQPFEYDEVGYDCWSDGENGYASVVKNGKRGVVNAQGKLVLPCEYSSIINVASNSPVVMISQAKSYGLLELRTGRIIIPAEYTSVGAFPAFFQAQNTLFEMGVYVVKRGDTSYFLDANGKEVFSTTKLFNEAVGGLYSFSDNSGSFDNRGRIVIEPDLLRTRNLEVGDSYTLFLQDGKVYRGSANYFDSTYAFKPAAPKNVTAVPSSTKLVVDGKSVATTAYNIGGSNYIKLRDLAAMVNGTSKNFNVTWDGAKNAVDLLSGQAYVPTGGEMTVSGGGNKAAVRPEAKIFVDGQEVSLTAYNIDGSNYFKLRDVMQLFDIFVGWDGATSTATISTSTPFALASYEQSKLDARNKAYESASGNQYQEKPLYKEPFVRFQTTPSKLLYQVGEPFETAGFVVKHVDIYGRGTDITKDIVLKVDSTEIYDGYQFQEGGQKLVDCYYKGQLLNSFKVSVVSEDSNYLSDGDYYMQIFGKYLTPVSASGIYYLELSDQKPEKPFTVKLINVDDDRGPMYHITYNGAYVGQPSSRDGAQLQTVNMPHQWRINQYSSFCTIRDYGNQKLLVNAAGQQSKNGTKIIVWKTEGKAPDHSKILFTKVD